MGYYKRWSWEMRSFIQELVGKTEKVFLFSELPLPFYLPWESCSAAAVSDGTAMELEAAGRADAGSLVCSLSFISGFTSPSLGEASKSASSLDVYPNPPDRPGRL